MDAIRWQRTVVQPVERFPTEWAMDYEVEFFDGQPVSHSGGDRFTVPDDGMADPVGGFRKSFDRLAVSQRTGPVDPLGNLNQP